MNSKSIAGNLLGWLFGTAFLAIGLINSFWGNDPFFGVFIILLSLAFLPPVNSLVKKITGFSIPLLLKIAIGVFILWASLGVGELFDKIDMMMKDLG